MNLRAPAILLAARPHGESAVLARLLTQNHALIAAYIAGGRGRQLRPVMSQAQMTEAAPIVPRQLSEATAMQTPPNCSMTSAT